MRSERRHSQSIRSLATVLALVMGGALLAGCASGSDEAASASGADQSYPNLGDIPERPMAMTEEERERLEQGLVADSEGREYSEEVIAFQSEPAEPLPAPMETSAGGAEGSTLGEVTMPGAVTPPFSGGVDSPPSTFDAPSTPAEPAAPEVPATPPAPAAATPPAPTTATPPAPAAATSLSPAAATPVPVPAAVTPPAAPSASGAAAAAAAAQATPTNIPVPPDDPMARAVTPPFSGANSSVPPAAVPPPSATAAPSASSAAAPSAPYIAPYTPSAAYTPVPDASGAVPSVPAVTAGDVSAADLNQAQMDNLQPSPPPFSGTTGATPGSYAPTQLPGPEAGTRPTAVTSAYAPSSAPAPNAYAAPSATAASTPEPAPTGYAPPSAPAGYAPPPAVPASAPPTGVQDVFEARLQDPLPGAPTGTLPSGDQLDGGEPLTTVVVSSTGVATFEELPVNVPVLEREPVPAAAAGGSRGSLARKAVPGSSVKVATILFADGSSSLRDREREIVREVYQRYLASGRKVRVVGHSSSRTRNMDPVRHRMVNFGISAERANAVATELQRLGVPSEQITVVAAADDMPMYYEVMPSGEAGNRRTEIYLD